MQHAVPRVPSGVLRDLQRHLVNATAISVLTGSDIERCLPIVLSDKNAPKKKYFAK